MGCESRTEKFSKEILYSKIQTAINDQSSGIILNSRRRKQSYIKSREKVASERGESSLFLISPKTN